METLISDTRSQGRQNKTWIDNVKEDLQQRGSDMQQAAERVKDRKQWKNFIHADPSSATYGWRWTGHRKKELLDSIFKANDDLPQWCVSSRSFIILANSAGSTFIRESNRLHTSLMLLCRRSSTEPELWSEATRSMYMDDARPEPYENNTISLFAMSAAE